MTFPPITQSSEVRDMFPEDVEVAVWLDFGDPETLTRAARYIARELGGKLQRPEDVPDAEPGRHLHATVWPVTPEEMEHSPDDFLITADEGDDPRGIQWTNAYLLGVVRAAMLLAMCGAEGIGGRVYAIRVQPAGAVFPATYQVGDGPERVRG